MRADLRASNGQILTQEQESEELARVDRELFRASNFPSGRNCLTLNRAVKNRQSKEPLT